MRRLLPRWPWPCDLRPRSAKEGLERTIAEYITELREDVIHGHSTLESTAISGHSGMTKSVVPRTLVGVTQDLVGFGGFLEVLFRLLVAGVAVRVKFKGLLAVGFLYRLFIGILFDAQDLVIISFRHTPLFSIYFPTTTLA